MIARKIEDSVIQSLGTFPVVGILGSRQAGKTTLAKAIKERIAKRVVYLDLELPSDLNKLYEPELYLSRFSDDLVIIDEIQRMPSLFPLLRAMVDQNRVSGRFLVLGSSSPALIRHASESLAGRIVYHELPPLTLEEIGPANVQRLWLRGGYPDSYLAATDKESFSWREAFIKTFLEMDMPQLGIRVPSTQLRRFWTMVAHCHAQLWNASMVADSLGISAPTARKYLDILEETFVIRQLQPYHANLKKRLVKAPKVYLRDSGLLHALLRIGTFEDLQGVPGVGGSWEGFVIEQVVNCIPRNWRTYFYRTSAGAELDLVILDDKNEPIAVEIKYSLSPRVTKGFWNAFGDLSCRKGFVVYPGEESYPLADNVYTLPVKSISELTKLIRA
jgi:hypothetical protein